MAQAHLDRLSSIDAGFLHQEDGGAHMHIGGLAVFEGPPPTGEEFREHLASRLHLVPRYRQRLVPMPLGAGRPLWADDPSFRLDYHVRHTALPQPGRQEQLMALVSRVVSQRLDRTKPLWEIWLVEGLQDGRWALISKTHHAMVDGVAGVDLMAALLDLDAEGRRLAPEPWHPRPTPGAAGLLAAAARNGAGHAWSLARRGLGAALDPVGAARDAATTVGALAAAAQPFVVGAPPTPFNRPPGPHRSVEVVPTDLADHKAVKAALGGTVNDVVLTVVAGALGRFLVEQRGQDVRGLVLKACVPVSVRTEDRRGAAGNDITIMAAPLPVGVEDPGARLAQVRRAMQDLKSSRSAQGAQVLTSVENALPPVVLARASRLGFSSRLYNLLVTNVPGPQVPIHLLGRRMQQLAPLPFLAPEHTLALAVISYDGMVTYGLLGDADAVPDLAELATHLRESLARLVEHAQAQRVEPTAS